MEIIASGARKLKKFLINFQIFLYQDKLCLTGLKISEMDQDHDTKN
jgi:hypothetical protein